MIFYFSGTGNTRWVARQLANATNEELRFIPDEMKHAKMTYTLKEGERLGFCFPTHGWQPPRIVRQFIRQATFVTASPAPLPFIFAVTTCGDSAGDATTILNKELKAKGLQTDALFSVIMPESYVCLPFMYTDSPEREEEKITAAKRQLEHIGRLVKDRKRGIEELEKGATPRLYSYVIGSYFNHNLVTDRKFCVDEDICTKCGKCAKVCPVSNIVGTPPVWQHNDSCTMCLACYHYCPVHAINYGKRTRQRGQYYMKEKE